MKIAESAEEDFKDWAITRSVVSEEIENANWEVLSKIKNGELEIAEMSESQVTSQVKKFF